MSFKNILDTMIEHKASDIFIRAGSPLRARVLTEVKEIGPHKLSVEDVEEIVSEMVDTYKRDILQKEKSCEFTTWYGEHWRFRIGIFYQRNTLAVVIRSIDLKIPTFEDLNLPAKVLETFCRERRGLVLMTGITGSGKSTAIASMIEFINQNFGKHILTIEQPIEFTFVDKKSLINQREIFLNVIKKNLFPMSLIQLKKQILDIYGSYGHTILLY